MKRRKKIWISYNQLAEDFEIEIPMDEALVKGKVYKLPSNDMRLLYTGRF
ncbi:hypothetical protein IANJMKHF_00166 [Klebsiella phage CPRSA]|nr:hypothetical protein IANJMKHF_00166 [Klebsiella phage CPRSA]